MVKKKAKVGKKVKAEKVVKVAKATKAVKATKAAKPAKATKAIKAAKAVKATKGAKAAKVAKAAAKPVKKAKVTKAAKATKAIPKPKAEKKVAAKGGSATLGSRHLTRFDYGSTRGWQVRVPKSAGAAEYHSKFFADGKNGGNRKAYQSAQAYRDQYLKDTGQEMMLQAARLGLRTRKRHSHNTSGIVGVRRVVVQRGDAEYHAWQAYGMRFNTDWRKSFSVTLYGENEAFLAACRERFKRHGPLAVAGDLRRFPCKIDVQFEKIEPAAA